jgi:two-component system nitrate/nitrite sensor histidine kinase NarX
MRVLEALASQVGLLIENQRLYREVEFEAGLAERTRLAREIHDGLAQTLGYLKLRTARIMSWMRSGAEHRAQEGLEDLKFQLDAAYVDAREAIDGLSIDMRDGDFADLLAEITEEFHALAKIPIRTSPAPGVELGPEVQVQLLRIIQEALGNIRKHASASQAAIEWSEIDGGIVLQIRDDGCGFDPEDVPPISKHGLRIMRERADLLGAELQLTSEQGVGTAIEIRMPMAVEERGDEYPRG